MTREPHPHLHVLTEGPVRTITLANPDRRNAQTPSLWLALAEEARSVPDDVRVVVIRGEGPSFSAGIDTAMFSPEGVKGEESIPALITRGPEAVADRIGHWQQGFAGWSTCPAVVIAEIQGHAIGAGFQLALSADLRVVASDALFAMREISLGLVPDLAGTKPLVDLVGYSRALEICTTGRLVSAHEAERLGLVTVLAAPDGLEDATLALAEAILAAPATAGRAVKPLLRHAVGSDLTSQVERERKAQAGLLAGFFARPPK
ncbi:MAG: enoyl-CoA hydratase/isomerase family protein [Micrococcales bacterium]|nr:enoyl-CoA hydratase/isomerase family protein [Micrococcales bacterium]